MINPRTERHLAENEIIFRAYNERIQKGLEALHQLAQQTGQSDLEFTNDLPLHFYCECVDETCNKRVVMTPSSYTRIHEKRNRFVVIKGHNVPAIEKIVDQGANYVVIEKLTSPPQHPDELHESNINNL